MTLKEFFQKYDPAELELLETCLEQEKTELENDWLRRSTEKNAWGVIRKEHRALDLLMGSVDLAFDAPPRFMPIHQWVDSEIITDNGNTGIVKTNETGRKFAVGSGPLLTEEKRKRNDDLIDDFLFREICDTCGGQIYPGCEKSLVVEGTVLFLHPDCDEPNELYGGWGREPEAKHKETIASF